MMAKKPNRAISEQPKGTPILTQNINRKKITTHLSDRKTTGSLKNLAITKLFPAERTEEALREAERFLNSIFTSIQDGISILDKDMNIIRVNQTIERWYSHAMPLVGRKCYEAYHGRKERCDTCPTHQTILTGKGAYETVPKTGANGEIVGWLDLYSFPLIDTTTGKMKGVIEYVRDVTERKRAEEALRQSEEKYRTILESIQDGYFEVDLAGNLTFVNDVVCRYLGYTKKELIGENYRQYTDEETARRLRELYIELYRTGTPIEAMEQEVFRKDGTKGTVEVSVSLIKDSEGKPIGFRAVSRDITKRKRAEEALQESEKYFKEITENSSDIIIITDKNGDIKYCSRSIERFTGYKPEELIGRSTLTLIHPDDKKRAVGDFGKAILAIDPAIPNAFRIVHKDGSERYFEGLGKNLLDNPAVAGFIMNVRDITERKQAEEALHENEKRLQSLMDASPIGISWADMDGNIKYNNRKFRQLFGYTVDDIPTIAEWRRLAYPDPAYRETVPSLVAMLTEAQKQGKEMKPIEVTVTCKDGSTRNVEQMGAFASKQILAIYNDLTEHKLAEEALRQSEERYRTILENIQDGYFEVDLAGNLTFVNDAECVSLGYSRDELIGMNNRQYTDKENAKKLFQAFNKLYRTGEPVKGLDLEVIRKDGTKAFDELSVSLIRGSEGKPVGFRGISRDITERKRAEEALRHSEERYRNILESILEGYYEEDLAGNFVFFNEAMCRIYGYPKEELLGLNYKKYTSEETAKRLFQIFNEMYRTGNPCKEYSYELIRKDGVKRYIEASASLRRDSSGKPTGFRGVVRDATERKRAEEALRQSEERYRTIIENIQDGYFEVNLAGNFTFVNDAECVIHGYSRDELIGMNNRQYTDKENAKKVFEAFNKLYRTGELGRVLDYEIIRKDGTKAFTELSVSLIRNSEDKPIGFRGISRDITERKQAEEEKSFLQEQLRQSQKMEAIGQLAGGVAHDFNNLLTVIKGYSQLSLFDLKENDPLRGNIQEIEKATQRATDLTRQLLAFSRRQILDLKVLDLNVLLKDMEKMLRRIIGEDIELVILLSEDIGKVKVDPSQIEQVIFNLAVNARDAMPSGGRLAIETANAELDEEYAHAHVSVAPGRYVRLSVSDTGVGMTQEVKERVFEPFFTTKEKGKGTGLGLSMVYGIVKQSNGNIWVYSEPGRGTTFRIYFPRTEEEADTLREREEADFFPRGSETILLVEDDELVRDLANRLLEQQGYRVLKAANGQEALLVAKEHVGETIHLLLADIVMPQMGGKELADWLKISRPNVKVLFTSGYADNAIVHHGVLNPGTHFLQKPFSLKTLSNKVREVLDG